jgi:integral membrane sensor domain MASE1
MRNENAMDIVKSVGEASLDVGLNNCAAAEIPNVQTGSKPLHWGHLAATFFVLLLFSWLGIVLSRQSDGVATIWFTNGLLFALVVARPKNTWIPYFIAGFLADTLADVIYGDPLRLSIGVAVANSVEVIISSVLLTRWFGSPLQLTKRLPLLGFLGIAVVGATALTSALGASWTLLFVNAGPWVWQSSRHWSSFCSGQASLRCCRVSDYPGHFCY